jgi:PBSX family phage terminase large subunit
MSASPVLSYPEFAQYLKIDRKLRASTVTESRLKFYGNNQKMLESNEHQIVLSGPAETGKTYTCLEKLHRVCLAYKGVQAAIVRKTYQSMPGSVLQTFERIIEGSGVSVFGGAKPQWYDYPNKSKVWVGGMDHPDKVLSSERDLIYVNQVEELDLSDWETLRTRATGRAGHVPHPQVIGDCNPSTPTHWIKQMNIPLLESRHEDNPTLFNQETGELTEQGILSLSILDQLTGPRKSRLRYGQWAGAEGMVYEDSWDSKRNVVDRCDIPGTWRRYLAIDFGFTNPFVCQWWAEDDDGRLYLYREIYHTQRLVEDHARQIKQLSEGEKIEAVICDHDAEGRATFEKHAGMNTVPAKKDVLEGIQAVAGRLREAADKKARLFLMRDSLVERDNSLADKHKPTSTIDEVEGYVWKESSTPGRKEEPLKENDHGCDGMRYMVAHRDMNNYQFVVL